MDDSKKGELNPQHNLNKWHEHNGQVLWQSTDARVALLFDLYCITVWHVIRDVGEINIVHDAGNQDLYLRLHGTGSILKCLTWSPLEFTTCELWEHLTVHQILLSWSTRIFLRRPCISKAVGCAGGPSSIR